MTAIKTDEYGEVVNSEETYAAIAEELNGRSVVIGWTDGHMTHFDILFSLYPLQYGNLQGGVRGRTDLFVSIMRWGAFAFDASEHDTHPGYIEEKLGGQMGKDCAQAVADLINGVRRHLAKA